VSAKLTPYSNRAALSRSQQRALTVVRGEAALDAARIQGTLYCGFVASTGLAQLGALEERLIQQAPQAEMRLHRINDAVALACEAIIMQRAWGA
jgi:hypothetical protein